MTTSRNFQLQGKYTRYEDGFQIGFDCAGRHGNYKTFEAAVKAAKKGMKRNECEPVMKVVEVRNARGRIEREDWYDRSGNLIAIGDIKKYSIWHIDGYKIIDRTTLEVLWEVEA